MCTVRKDVIIPPMVKSPNTTSTTSISESSSTNTCNMIDYDSINRRQSDLLLSMIYGGSNGKEINCGNNSNVDKPRLFADVMEKIKTTTAETAVDAIKCLAMSTSNQQQSNKNNEEILSELKELRNEIRQLHSSLQLLPSQIAAAVETVVQQQLYSADDSHNFNASSEVKEELDNEMGEEEEDTDEDDEQEDTDVEEDDFEKISSLSSGSSPQSITSYFKSRNGNIRTFSTSSSDIEVLNVVSGMNGQSTTQQQPPSWQSQSKTSTDFHNQICLLPAESKCFKLKSIPTTLISSLDTTTTSSASMMTTPTPAPHIDWLVTTKEETKAKFTEAKKFADTCYSHWHKRYLQSDGQQKTPFSIFGISSPVPVPTAEGYNSFNSCQKSVPKILPYSPEVDLKIWLK